MSIASELEQRVVEILKKMGALTSDEELFPDYNKSFEELGLNSIAYIQLLVFFENDHGIEIPDEMLNYDTQMSIANLAQQLNDLLDERKVGV